MLIWIQLKRKHLVQMLGAFGTVSAVHKPKIRIGLFALVE
jgi:hypothetical protein